MIRPWKVFFRITLALVILAGLESPVPAQTPPRDDETWNQYQRRLVQEATPQAKEAAETATERTVAAVAAKPTSVTPPESFGGRVNDAFADFLPLFQFAVDTLSTSDDQRSVTVKFNPLKFDFGVFALSGTVTEPQVFSNLEEAIDEPVRESQREALLKSIDDYSDVTAALSFGYRRKAGNWSNSQGLHRLYGRDATLYRSLIEELMFAAFAAEPESIQVRRDLATAARGQLGIEIQKLLPAGKSLDTATFAEIRAAVKGSQLAPNFEARLQGVISASTEAQVAFNTYLGSLGLDALPALIDNQPQIVASASHRASVDVVGPDSTAYTFSYEMGSNNFNAVLSRYRELLRQRHDTEPSLGDQGDNQLKLQALRDVVAQQGFGREHRLVFSATYKDVSEYSFRHNYNLVGTDGAQTPRIVDLHLDGTQEWRAKVLWTRLMPMALSSTPSSGLGFAPIVSKGTVTEGKEEEQRPRLTFSLEGVWPEGTNAAKDQVIGRLSYLLPVARGVTIPVTVTYANRDDLLGEQDHVFGGHLGISYKLGQGNTQGSTQ